MCLYQALFKILPEGTPGLKACVAHAPNPTLGEMLRPFIPTPTALLFPLSCRPLSLSLNGSNFADEEKSSYLESINRVLEHSPAVDLAGDSTSATSPGYRCFLAGVAKVAGPEGKPAALRRGPLLFPAAVQAAFTKITTYVPVLATS